MTARPTPPERAFATLTRFPQHFRSHRSFTMQPRSTAVFAYSRPFFRPQTSWFTISALILACATLLPQSAFAQAATQTPAAVVDGSAKLVQHANPSQLLRVVLGMERPHPDREEQFLQDLHTKGTKGYR